MLGAKVVHFSNLVLGDWTDERQIVKILDMKFSGNPKQVLHGNKCMNGSLKTPGASSCLACITPSPRSSIWKITSCLSESRISDSPVHLQRRHLHIWDLGVLGASCRAVSSRSSHGTESSCGATYVGETWRSRQSRTPQEPAWSHQVPVALRVREGVAWATGAGAADAGA